MFGFARAVVYADMSASPTRRTPLAASLTPSKPRSSAFPDEHVACRREIQRLFIENARLASDLANTKAQYEDLKRSAEIWIALYERRLERKAEQS